MPQTPDFDQIAQNIADLDAWRPIAEQLRLVWNARGAADIAKVETCREPAGAADMNEIDLAIRSLDR